MSELNPIRIAVIGAGAMGRNHIRFVTEEPEAELVAIADAFEGARATAEAAGVPFYTDPAQMMDEVKPEAVIIATPNDRNKKSFPSYLSKSNIYRSPCQAQLYNSIRHLYNIGPTT